jgi:DNA sulfur modification protein DndB
LVRIAVDFWASVAKVIPEWSKVKNGDLRPLELRQENISTHSVVLRALGAVGSELMLEYPDDWKAHLLDLTTINWSKKNREWESVNMVANSVVSNRQARLATKAYLKYRLGLTLNDAEVKSIASLASLPA